MNDDYTTRYQQAVERLTTSGPFALTQASVNGHQMPVYANAPKTVNELLQPGRTYAERDCVVYEGERWSYNQVFQQADAISQGLADTLGVRKGDRVAIAMRNLPEWMTVFIAIVQIGAVAVPLNSWGRTRELTQGLNDAGARVVFCDPQRLEYIEDALPQLGIEAVVVRPNSDQLPRHSRSLETFLADKLPSAPPQTDISGNDIAMIMYTSGTTGAPKGAVSTHFALCQAIYSFEVSGALSAMLNPSAVKAMSAKGYPSCSLLSAPLFHVSGLHAHLLAGIRSGRKVVMLYKWDIEQACRHIESERVTLLNAPPSVVQQLLESPQFSAIDSSSLFSISGGGAASPPRLISLIDRNVANSLPSAAWGMTESNGIGTGVAGEGIKNKPHTSGLPHPVVQLRISDETGKSCPTGEQGEIWIKSPTNISAYWNRPEANASDFYQGWFKTGDIGYLDKEGYLVVCDRAKDMVIRGGENIYSIEVETLIASHPAVEEVAAVPVPDEKMGEELGVLVRPAKNAKLSGTDIQTFVEANLARFKVPRYVVFRTEEFAKNASGKILKKQALQILLAGITSPEPTPENS
ncbi:acyl--CoA ligase [Pseudomaricurvus alkylphenolicus]|uniref:class I adenylate-forming enzyme family protein n=1 Tax=Pseudomaricurvus alkylphenolicus TaxID=1306991 RepID=UPI00141E74D6|nr:class I adenylate-forming enzyme family protein [Pseudomaricurvus alkylphenolicus]NIB38940.1 acyl--CoA ligase [Pseudomaricurvus alkylphenolicus]